MAFTVKTWLNRISEYPNRRTLDDGEGNLATYTISRNEGQVSQQGDAFSAENMNDLESRINDAFTALETEVTEDIDTAVAGIKSVQENLTLAATSWNSSNMLTLNNDNIHVDSTNGETIQEITLRRGATIDEARAFAQAIIIDGGQAEHSMTLKALGTKPTIDIRVTVIYRGYK